MLHLLLQQQKVQIDNINNLLVEILKKIGNKCKISTSQRSIVSIHHSAKYSFITLIFFSLTPKLHMEVGCLGTWGLE